MDAPERIWAWKRDDNTEAKHYYRQWEPYACHWMGKDAAEYILATPAALAASPEVQALIREAEARVWEQVRLRDQRIRELEARDGIILLRNEPYGGASGGGTGC
jgi:hypothetical protein